MKKEGILKILFKFSYGSWIQAFISLLSLPLFARYLTPSEFAVISLFTLVYSISISVIFLGIDQAFIRFYYQYENRVRFINSYLLISLISLILSSILICLFNKSISIYIFGNQSWMMIVLLIIHLFTGIIFRYITLVLRCENLSILFSNSQIFISVSYVLLSFFFVFCYNNAYSLILGTVLSQLLVTCYLLLKVRHLFFFNLTKNFIDQSFIKEIFNYSLAYIPIIFLDWLFLNYDKSFLRKFSDLHSLGLYFSAYKLVYALNIIQIGFKSFWFPYAIKEYEKEPESYREFRQISSFLIFGFTFVILSMSALRNYLILIFPTDYYAVSKVFPVLLLVPFLLTLYDVASFGINYYKKTYYHIASYVIALIVGIPLAYFLIPIYKLYGAAIASVVSSIVYFICGAIFNSFFIKPFINWSYFIINIALILISGFSAFFTNAISNYLSVLAFILFLLFNFQLIKKVCFIFKNQYNINFKK